MPPLPPYPELVTKLSSVVVNHPDKRSASAYVQALLQLNVKERRYATDEYGTKCNFYVHDVLHVMGYPVPFMLARDYIKFWRKAEGPVKPMVFQDALINASCGCPTVFGLLEPDNQHSHVGVVLPQRTAVKLGDLIVANVGASNFYGRSLRWAVALKDLPRVEFFGAP